MHMIRRMLTTKFKCLNTSDAGNSEQVLKLRRKAMKRFRRKYRARAESLSRAYARIEQLEKELDDIGTATRLAAAAVTNFNQANRTFRR